MAIEKFIIDKSELPALLKGEDIAIQPKKNIKGFRVEIAGNLTNGDMIKSVFPDAQIDYHEKSDLVESYVTVFPKDCDTCQDYTIDYWNAPYKKEAEKSNKGQWINILPCTTNFQDQIIYQCVCDKCSSIAYFRRMGDKLVGANICPTCGAEMQEVEE